jgi:hypothetical protein
MLEPALLEALDAGTAALPRAEDDPAAARERAFGASLARVAEAVLYARIPVRRFLDVGTGHGFLLDALAHHLPRAAETFFGVERHPPERRSRHPNYRAGTIGSLTERFDAGTCIEVVQTLTPAQLSVLLAELAARSNPGALYLVNSGQPGYVEDEDPGYLDPDGRGHVASYSVEAVARLAAPHGFQVLPLQGKSWAVALEYGAAVPVAPHDRIWSVPPRNAALLRDPECGSVLYLLGLESARAYAGEASQRSGAGPEPAGEPVLPALAPREGLRGNPAAHGRIAHPARAAARPAGVVAHRRPRRIYVVGDSHALIYADRTVTDRAGTSAVTFTALHCRDTAASTCVGPDGRLAPGVRRALAEARLVVEDGDRIEALHRTTVPAWRYLAVAEDRAREDPALVFAFGGLDAFHLGARLPADTIRVPAELRGDAPAGLYATPPGSMPFAEALMIGSRELRPFADLLYGLRALGFGRMALLSVPPPTANDDAFRAAVANVQLDWSEPKLRLPFRHQIIRVVNEALRGLAAELGIPFVDRWADQVVRGVAAPGLLHDWLHIGSRPANETAAVLADLFYGLGRGAAGSTAGD